LTSEPTSSVGGFQHHVEFSNAPIAFFVATRWELAALRRALPVDREETVCGIRCLAGQTAGRSYWLVQSGVGPQCARSAARAVLERNSVALAISSGFAGALVPARVGDLIIGTGTRSISFEGTWKPGIQARTINQDCVERMRLLADQLGIATKVGMVVSAARVVGRSVDKQAISRMTGAVALDMESAALAQVAEERGVPFVVVRTVSDLVEEELPLDFNAFLGPSAWRKGLYELMTHPASLIGLNRLRKQSRLAAGRLTAFCSAYGEQGFGMRGDHNLAQSEGTL